MCASVQWTACIEQRQKKATRAARAFAPDALRGLIIIFMALDHANHFVAQGHSSGEYWGGVFPAYDDPLVFLTRFVTHFCAPGFFLLMGLGMVMFARTREQRGWARWQIIRQFLIRGGMLIALQFLVVNQAWNLSPGGWGIQIYLGVLFALGGSMIAGSLLLWLKPVHLLGLTLALLVGTELLVPDAGLWGAMSAPKLVLLVPGGIIRPTGDVFLWSNYQTLPWLGLATLGMVFGHWLADDPRKAFGRAWKIGLACLAGFVVVRCLDGFGNIRPRMGDGWIDLLNLVKYPPSVAFTLMTTGVNLSLLWLLSRAGERVQRVLQPLVVLGQAPLFFYVQHLFLYAMLGHLLAPEGTSIAPMYLVWLLGLLILFPLCLGYRWFRAHQPAHQGMRLVWDSAITVFGPVGLLTYWLEYEQAEGSSWRRVLGATMYSVIGTSAGLLLPIVFCYVFLPDRSIRPLVLLAPLVVGWLVFRAPLMAARMRIGYVRAAGRALLTEIISTCLVIAGLVPVLYLGVDHWLGGQNDLAHPLWWGILNLAVPAGALLVYPFHLWLADRGFDGRVPETATHAATPSLRNAWLALLCSLVLVVVSLGLTG
ncbi:MAG: DUF4396 domain-containing protein [Anaerolineae bacterium]|nr:DUF4396 domain-containing protein [Anaerolineae bacterium]